MSVRTLLFAIAVGGVSLAACRNDPVPSAHVETTTGLADAGAPKKPGPVDVLPVPKDVVAKTVNPEHWPEYKGPTGVVEGTVYVTGEPAPPLMGKSFEKCPEGADFYAKTFREGKEVDGKRPLADAIVAVTGYGPGYYIAEKNPSKVLTISHCAYSARTVDLTFGQSLDVKNEGSAPMFAPDFENQSSPAIMVATLGGDPVHLYPKKPGRYRLIDRLGYSYLEADVFVLYQPLHTVSDITGHFRIEGVPVGKLKVNVEHPAIAGQHSEDVEVKDGVVTKVTLTVPNVKAAARPVSRDVKPILP